MNPIPIRALTTCRNSIPLSVLSSSTNAILPLFFKAGVCVPIVNPHPNRWWHLDPSRKRQKALTAIVLQLQNHAIVVLFLV